MRHLLTNRRLMRQQTPVSAKSVWAAIRRSIAALVLVALIFDGVANSFAGVSYVAKAGFQLEDTALAATGIFRPISYQGKVSLTNGAAITNGSYNMRFKIFNASTGGVAAWTETWDNSTQRVTMTGGLFSVLLGTHTTMTGSVNFNQDSLFLQIEFDPGNDTTYEEVFTPRRRFASVPYAHNTDTLDGLDSTKFVRKDQSETLSGTVTVKPNDNTKVGVDIQTTAGVAATAALKLSTQGANHIVFGSGATNYDTNLYRQVAARLRTDGSFYVGGTLSGATLAVMGSGNLLGNIGIGKSATARTKLEVVGTISGSSLVVTGNTGIGTYTPKTKLEVVGTISGSALTVTGLKSCAFIVTNSAGATSCGTTSTFTYTAGQGLSVSSNVFRLNSTITGSLVRFTTVSGSLVYARNTLSSSGTLSVLGATVLQSTLNVTGNSTFDTNTMFVDASANNVGIGTTSPKATLDVVGSVSGSSLTVTALKSCAMIITNVNGTTSCGTAPLSLTTGDGRFVNVSGDTMTGALAIQNGTVHSATATPLLNVRGTMSGATVFGTNALATSGSVIIKSHVSNGISIYGNVSGANFFDINAGNFSMTTKAASTTLTLGTVNTPRLVIDSNGHTEPGSSNSYDLGITGTRWRTLYLSGAGLKIGASGTNTSAIDYRQQSGTWGLGLYGSTSTSTPHVFLTSGGLLGVGSIAPKAKLDVVGTVSGALITQNGAGTNYFIGNIGVGKTAAANAKLEVLGSLSGQLLTINSGASGLSYITGNLGIGRTTANTKLEVQGTISGSALTVTALKSCAFVVTNSAGATSCGSASTFTYTAGQGLSVSSNVFRLNSTITGSLVRFTTVSGSLVYAKNTLSSSGTLSVLGATVLQSTLNVTGNSTFDTNTLFVDASANNVGIGTTSPKATLDVVGSVSGSSLTVTALKSCAMIITNVNGTTSCGTAPLSLTTGDGRFVNVSGDTMTGALAIQNGTAHTATTTPLLVVRGTMSGRSLYITGTGASPMLMTNITTGNVGIGTSGPKAKLGVVGTISGTTVIANNIGIGVNPTSRLNIRSAASTFPLTLSDGTVNYGFYQTAGAAWLGTISNHAFQFFVNNGGSAMTIDTTGNIGVGGTTSPQARLSFGTTFGSPAIHIYEGGAGSRYGFGVPVNDFQTFIPAGVAFTINSGGDLQAEGTNELMRVQSDGNVGVGTITPKAKLDVAGSVSGSSLTVTGLKSCAFVITNSAGATSCGSASTFTYTAGQGLSVSSNVFRLNSTITGSLVRFTTVSGSLVYAKNTLSSSGTLAVTGNSYLGNSTLFVDANNQKVGINGIPTNALSIYDSSSQIHFAFTSGDSAGGYLASSDDDNAALSAGSTFVGIWVARAGSASILDMNEGNITFSTDINLTPGNTFAPTERMRIANTGNVGIGTATPKAKLDVVGTLSGQALTINSGAAGLSYITGNLGIGRTTANTKLEVQGTISGSALTVTGLKSCAFVITNSAGATSCGTASTFTYTAGQGLSVSSNVFRLNSTITGSLVRFTTVSGSLVYARNTLSSSGTLSVLGATVLQSTLNVTGNSTFDTNTMFVDASANRVGIGTTSADAALDVVGTISGALITQNGAGTNYFIGNIGVGKTAAANAKLEVLGSLSGQLLTINSGAAGLSYITGNLGIGKTSASTKLEVQGTISGSALTVTGLKSCAMIITNVNGTTSCGTAPISSATMESRYVNVSGDTMTGALAIQNGTVHSATTTPLLNVRGTMSGRSLYITGTGASPMLMTNISTGRVGIGTATPQTTLDVNGYIQNSYIKLWRNGGTGTYSEFYNDTSRTGMTAGIQFMTDNGAGGAGGKLSFLSGSQGFNMDPNGGVTTKFTYIYGGNSAYMELGSVFDVYAGGSLTTAIGAGGTKGYLNVIPGGNVGIGTNAPQQKFQVSGSGYITGNLGIGKISTTTQLEVVGAISGSSLTVTGLKSCAMIITNVNGTTSCGSAPLSLTTGDSRFVNVSGDTMTGALAIQNGTVHSATTTPLLVVRGTMSGQGLYITGTGSTPMFMTQVTTGNIGIGKSNPKAKLDVVGTISGSALVVNGSVTQNTPSVNYFRGNVGINSSASYPLNVYSSTVSQGLFYGFSALGNNQVSDGEIRLGADVSGYTRISHLSGGPGDSSVGSLYIDNLASGNIYLRTNMNSGSFTGAYIDGLNKRFGINKNAPKSTLDVSGTISGAVITQNGGTTNYFLGNLGIGRTTANTKLEVQGTISGSALTVTGLKSCAFVVTNSAGATSCGTASTFTYTAGQGLSVSSNVFRLNSTITGSLVRFTTVSGSLVYAKNTLSSSGTLSVLGATVLQSTLNVTGNSTFDTNTMFVDASANRVGIGTTSADAALDVVGTISGALITQNGAGTNYLIGNLGIGKTTTSAKLDVLGSLSGQLLTINSGAAGLSYITGNLGIGKTAPSTKLDVRGTISGSLITQNGAGTNYLIGNVAIGKTTLNSSTNLEVLGTISGTTLVASNSIRTMGVGVTGRNIFYGTLSVGKNSSANTTIEAAGTISGALITQNGAGTNYFIGNIGVGKTAAANAKLEVLGSLSGQLLTINSGAAGLSYITGNLGIGKTSASTKLEVQGTISGSALTVTGLKSCAFVITNSAGATSCGSASTFTYLAGQGLTLAGNSFRLNSTITGSLVRFTTVSGSLVYAKNTLSSSGTLSVLGATVLQSTLNVTGNSTFDTNTLFVDASANNVGIGTTSPKATLDVLGSVSGSSLTVTGLKSCAMIITNVNGTTSCGTAPISSATMESRYVNVSGDTMTGALAIQNGTAHSATTTPLLNVRGTMSGRSLYITGTGAAPLFMTNITTANIGIGTAGPKAKLDVVGTISGSTLTVTSLKDCGFVQTNTNGVQSCGTQLPVSNGGTNNDGTTYTDDGLFYFDLGLNQLTNAQNVLYDSAGQTLLLNDSLGDPHLWMGPSPSLNTVPTAGLQTEVTNQLLDFGTNFAQLGGYTDNSIRGAFFRIDTRNGFTDQLFSVTTIEPSSSEVQVFKVSTDGDVTGNGSLHMLGAAVNYVTGNLGVGRTTARTKLEVQGTISGALINQNGAGSNFFAGNIGVGKTTNTAKLDVLGTISGSLLTINGGATGLSYILGNVSIGKTTSTAKLDVVGTISGSLLTVNGGATGLSYLLGNVSIGKTTSTAKLDVVGTISGASLYASGYSTLNGNRLNVGGLASAASFHFGTEGLMLKQSAGGRSMMEIHSPDSSVRAIAQSVNGAGFYFSTATNSAIYFYTNTTTLGLHVESTGQVVVNGVNNVSSSISPLVINGTSGQSAALTQWRNSSTTVLSSMSQSGWLAIGKTTLAKTPLDVVGTMSGTALTLSGLRNCNLDTDSNGVLTCGTDATGGGGGNFVSKGGDTMTGVLVIQNGTVHSATATPLLNVRGTMSGQSIYLTGTGASPMFMTQVTTGNVGIGKSNPKAKLDVVGTISGSLIRQNGAGQNLLWGNVSIGTTNNTVSKLVIATPTSATPGVGTSIGFHSDSTGNNYHSIRVDTSNSLVFDSWNGSWAGSMTILTNGNIGIGKTTPNAKLDVVGTISGAGLVINGTSTMYGNVVPGFDNKYDLGTTSARWRHLFLSGGSLRIGSSSMDGRIGYQTNGFEGLQFSGSGSSVQPQMFLSSGGLLGIGTRTPTAALTVSGSTAGMQLVNGRTLNLTRTSAGDVVAMTNQVRAQGTNNALTFTAGSAQSVTLPSAMPALTSFTVSTWWNATQTTTWAGPVSYRQTGKAGFQFVGDTSASSPFIPHLLIWNGSSETAHYKPTSYTLAVPFGGYYHMVWTYEGGTARFYVNGVEQAVTTTIVSGYSNGMNIGAAYQPTSSTIDDTRIYSRVLTPAEVAKLATGADVSRKNLVGEWLFNEGTGTFTADSSGNGYNGVLVNSPSWTSTVPSQAPGQLIEYDVVSTESGAITNQMPVITTFGAPISDTRLTGQSLRLLSRGTERIRVSSGGFVGIGTTNPMNTLAVSGSVLIGNLSTARANKATLDVIGTLSGQLLTINSSAAGLNYITGNLGIGKTTPSTKLDVRGTISGSLVTQNGAGTNYLIGNVAIGKTTLNSSTNFEVLGSMSGTSLRVSNNMVVTGVGSTGRNIFWGSLAVGKAATPTTTIDAAGTISGALINQNGAGTNFFIGNIGVGKTTTTAKLDVVGTISGAGLVINGTSTFFGNVVPGTDNKFDLGTSSTRFRHLYLSGGSLRLGTSSMEGRIGYQTNGFEGLQFFGSGSAVRPQMFMSSGGVLGIGSGNSLVAKTTIFTDNNLNQPAMLIKSKENGIIPLFKLTTDFNSVNNTVFDLYSNGSIVMDGDIRSNGFYVENPGANSYFNDRLLVGSNSYQTTAQMEIYTPDAFGAPALVIDSNESAGGQDLFVIRSEKFGTDDNIFRVDSNGDTYNESATYTSGADYAEFFKADDYLTLTNGDVVCVDTTQPNAVKKCSGASDPNLMGIISTKPAFVGNAVEGNTMHLTKIGVPVPGYVLVGLIGQVPAKVIVESGAVIHPGDSLTSASKPGYARLAKPGETTVGVALEGLASGEGVVNVLISRTNKSLTVDMMDQKVRDNIAALEIGDQITQALQDGLSALNLSNEVRSAVEALTQNPIDSLTSEVARLKMQITTLSGAVSGQRLAVSGTSFAGSNLTMTGSLSAGTVISEGTLTVSDDARIGGDLYLEGSLRADSLFLPNGLRVDGNMEVGGEMTVDRIHAGSGSTMSGTIMLQGSLRAGSGSSIIMGTGSVIEMGTGSVMRIQDLMVRGALQVLGPITIHGLATFLGDVEVKGELIVSSKQAGYASIKEGQDRVTVLFGSGGFVAVPVVTASPDVPVLYAVSKATSTGFTIRIKGVTEEDITFSWLALGMSSTASTQSGSALAPTIGFPIDAAGVPVSSNDVWNACIRNIPTFDEGGQPFNCSRYHSANQWDHPDLLITFVWNDTVSPPLLQLPAGYTPVVTQAPQTSSSSSSSEESVSSSSSSSSESSESSSSVSSETSSSSSVSSEESSSSSSASSESSSASSESSSFESSSTSSETPPPEEPYGPPATPPPIVP